MCSSPVLIKFGNPERKNWLCNHLFDAKLPMYKYHWQYRKGLKYKRVKDSIDFGLFSSKHFVPHEKSETIDILVNEPLSETMDSYNYPFPSQNYIQAKPAEMVSKVYVPFSYYPDDSSSPILCMYVPCGKCSECVSKLKSEVSDIVARDINVCKDPCSFFITLTYDAKYLPTDTDKAKYFPNPQYDGFAHCPTGFLCREDLALYIKRLRITLERWYDIKDIRIVYCGEYGKNTVRPHYHLLIWFEYTDKAKFGYDYEQVGNHKQHSGKKSLFDKYIARTGKVPPLKLHVFSSISYALWHRCAPWAHRVELPRSLRACGEYISKYILKTKLGIDERLKSAFAPSAIPCFFRISNNIGNNLIGLFSQKEFLCRGTIIERQNGKFVEIPINPRIMRKVSRAFFNMQISDLFIERSRYLTQYVVKHVEDLILLYSRIRHVSPPSDIHQAALKLLQPQFASELTDMRLSTRSSRIGGYLRNQLNSINKHYE